MWAKVHHHTQAHPFSIPAMRFDHVLVDLVGPLPPLQDFIPLVTMMDETSSISLHNVWIWHMRSFLHGWLISAALLTLLPSVCFGARLAGLTYHS